MVLPFKCYLLSISSRMGHLRLQGQNVMEFCCVCCVQCYYMLFSHKTSCVITDNLHYCECVLVLLFLIAVPVGTGHGFNSASYIFGTLINNRDYGTAWSFFLSWLPAIWTIGSFDSTIHCSEEAKMPRELYLLVLLVLLAPVEF